MQKMILKLTIEIARWQQRHPPPESISKIEIPPAPNLVEPDSAPVTLPKASQIVATQDQAHLLITDQVQQSAMAPLKLPNDHRPSTFIGKKGLPSTLLYVQARDAKANLYSGPGIGYSIIGNANPNKRYVVADWNNRWFKLAYEHPEKGPVSVGWIRNDWVKVISTTKSQNEVRTSKDQSISQAN